MALFLAVGNGVHNSPVPAGYTQVCMCVVRVHRKYKKRCHQRLMLGNKETPAYIVRLLYFKKNKIYRRPKQRLKKKKDKI